ncbi:MAG: DUF4175 family protein [Chloroherpetonaceae bacterium]|nr:DUF4175 domain-containing protein [Chloroherpetonaceae bacterium]MCS7210031.1 DUF4175 domain-containing protein [Chloroherpetonaceae bacterium]MDW8019348.1 DUF4175 family protein [Chloroherpetonaceae bacterium]
MSSDMLHALTHEWNRKQFVGLVLSSAGISLVPLALTSWFVALPLWGLSLVWFTLAVGTGGVLHFLRKVSWATPAQVAQHLNRVCPELEESAELLLAHPDDLPPLQRLQRQRICNRLSAVQFRALLPNPIRPALLRAAVGIICALCIFGTHVFVQSLHTTKSPSTATRLSSSLPADVPHFHITIVPPHYTGKPTIRLSQPNISFPQGSTALFELHFSQPTLWARLVFNARDTLLLYPYSQSHFAGQTVLNASGFYTLEFADSAGALHTSDFYTLEMQPDQAPTIVVSEPMLRSEVDMLHRPAVWLKAHISDDYCVSTASVVVTTAHGKGENITFKEYRLPFAAISGETYSLRLDLVALGLSPGDELYFFVEALDTYEPKPHRTRSETHFVFIKDTADTDSEFSMSLPIAEQPEYFRSQRQIIIDTEKLLREKALLSEAEFNRRSEAIGVDQKVLRLRYGKFLGEEFESAIGGTDIEEVMNAITPKDSVMHPLMKFVRHIHDEHCGHLKLSSDAAEKGLGSESVEKIMSRFMHIHDSEEGATFYSDDIKAQLKAALAEMWEAELYLRMHRPAEALPFELKALRLLKTLQHQSRLYVQRMGFEPPPLKPDEKRLSGKLENIQSRLSEQTVTLPDAYQPVRAALTALQKAKAGHILTGIDLHALEQGGMQLAEAARHQPTQYLRALSLLRRTLSTLERKAAIASSWLEPIEHAFLSLLPPAESSVSQPSSLPSSVGHMYLNSIRQIQ